MGKMEDAPCMPDAIRGRGYENRDKGRGKGKWRAANAAGESPYSLTFADTSCPSDASQWTGR